MQVALCSALESEGLTSYGNRKAGVGANADRIGIAVLILATREHRMELCQLHEEFDLRIALSPARMLVLAIVAFGVATVLSMLVRK